MASKLVGSKISEKEFDSVQRKVKAGEFLSVSDFVRTAVREKLGLEKTIVSSKNDLRKKVLDYAKKHGNVVSVNAANELGLDYYLVDSILKELK